jgi:protein-S-isoprenylcysteine O-methyltransferase Ste14
VRLATCGQNVMQRESTEGSLPVQPFPARACEDRPSRMKPSDLLFRFRSWILGLIFLFGFWAPWERVGGAHPGSAWLWLAGSLAAAGLLPIASSTILVVGSATLLLFLAALVRTWAAAYLGSNVVQDRDLHAEREVAGGPYRYVRNPLYLGTWLGTLGLAILMPPGGAVFAVVAVAALNAVLVFIEERKLTAERRETYSAYRKQVPRFFPAISPRIPADAQQPHWLQGFLGEIHIWGMALTYLLFADRYNVTILEQGVLISVGVAFLVQAIWRPSVAPAS